MQHIEIYVDGKTYGKMGSGFAIILLSKANEWKRSFAYGNYTSNFAELLAVKFGLLSVADPHKNKPIKLFVKSPYVRSMLERDKNGFIKIPNKNKELISEIRSMINDNVEVLKSDGPRSKLCSELVQNAVKNNKLIDERK